MYLQDREADRSRARTMTGSFSIGSLRESEVSGNLAGNIPQGSANPGWKAIPPPLNLSHRSGAATGPMVSTRVQTSTTRPTQGDWGGTDFPPLADGKNERKADFGGVWGEKKFSHRRDDDYSIENAG